MPETLRNVLFALVVAGIYPFGLYVANISYLLCFAAPLILVALWVRGHSKGVPNQSDGYAWFVAWVMGFLVALAYGSWQRGDDLHVTRLFDLATLAGPLLAISTQLSLRQGVIQSKSIEWGAIGCSLIFVFLVLIKTPISYWSLIPLFRFGVTADMNPNHIADIYDVLIPIVAFMALSTGMSSWKGKVLALILSVLLFVHFLTGTRGSLPSLAFVLIYLISSNMISNRSRIILIICIFGAVAMLSENLISRLVMKTAGDLLSSITRVWLLSTAIDMLEANHYFFGFGIDRFATMKLDFGFPRWVDPKGYLSSHNLHLDVYLGFGLIGILGWIIFNMKLLINLFAVRKHVPKAWVGIISLLGFLIHSLVDCLLVLNSFIVLIWIFYGYWMHLGDNKRLDQPSQGVPTQGLL